MKLIVKIIINGFIVVSMLMWFTKATFGEATVAALILSVFAYIVGDQFVLRISNNTIATIVDAALALVLIGGIDYFMNWGLSFTELLMITLVLGISEAIFHRFIASEKGSAAS